MLGAVWIFPAKDFFAAKKVFPVIASFVEVAQVIGYVGNPDNVRSLYDGREQRRCHKQQKQNLVAIILSLPRVFQQESQDSAR